MAESSSSVLHNFIEASKRTVGFVKSRITQKGKAKSTRKPCSTLPDERQWRRFSHAEIATATNNFESIIGGRNGNYVYKGFINDGSLPVAIKRSLSPYRDTQAEEAEFRNEVCLLGQLRHPNIVSLLGFCSDGNERFLVYEYVGYATLFDYLHSTDSFAGLNPIPWTKRLEICIAVARALHYLHSGLKYLVIHRDVTSKNILLDDELAPKLSGFKLSKLGPAISMSKTMKRIESEVMGTLGYLDPEYFHTSYLSEKSDVYSFGVVLLEVLCGKRAVSEESDGEYNYLNSWASQCIKDGTIYDIIDPHLKGRIAPDSFKQFVEIAMSCICYYGNERPSMGEVEVTLELALQLQAEADSEMETINPNGEYMYEDTLFYTPWRFCYADSADGIEDSLPGGEE